MATPTVQDIWQDPDFHGLNPVEKGKVMANIDPDFAALPRGEQDKVVFQLSNKYIDQGTKVAAPTTSQAAPSDMLSSHTPGAAVPGAIPNQNYLQRVMDPQNLKAYLETQPAQGLGDWATRVVPESLGKLPLRMATGAYQAIKGQTDPLINSATNGTNPAPSMLSNAYKSATGLGAAMLQGVGFGQTPEGNVNWSLDNAKNAWATDPAGSALGLAPFVPGVKALPRNVVNAIPPSVERSMYQRGLKGQGPFNGLKTDELNRRLDTALNEQIPLTEGGVTKLKSIVGDINNEVQQRINDYANNGETVNVSDALAPVANVRAKAANEAFPNKANAQINSTVNEFVNNPAIQDKTVNPVDSQPSGEIPIAQAQKFKQSINRGLDDFYNAMNKSPDKAAYLARQWVAKTQAAIGDGLRAQISDIFPEVSSLNQREGALLQLNKSLERAVNRIGQRDIVSLKFLTGLIHSPKTAFTEYILTNPKVQSSLAIALRTARNRLNGIGAPEITSTPPTPQTPAPSEPNPMEGKVNTLNLPVGTPQEPYPGRVNAGGIVQPTQQPYVMNGVNSLQLPTGEQMYYDPNLRTWIKRQQ